jgi:succinate dehydrogenase / fumarate reductase cytochrome b subunit
VKVAYYPGCVAQESGKELDMATRWVAPRLGIELVEFPKFSCCGSGFVDEANLVLNVALNARNLSLAEAAGLDLLTICSTCQGMLTLANRTLATRSDIRAQVDAALEPLGIRYRGSTKVKHLLQILVDDIGVAKIGSLVRRPLRGLKVGAFYGCHLLRPRDTLGWEDSEDPHGFEDLIRALGAEPVLYRGRVMCCGFPILFVKEPTANRIAARQVEDAAEHGADAMATPCPLCHISLDTYQPRAAKEVGRSMRMPIFHLPQLLGLAFGASPEDLGLERHMIPVDTALQKIGAVAVSA